MKKLSFIIPVIILLLVSLISARIPDNLATQAYLDQLDETELYIPEDVEAVLDKACYDCHHERSGNLKAKSKLNFDKWDGYKDTKKISKLEEICEEINSGDMPPEKYKEKYPENTPTKEEIKLVCDWTKEQQNAILGQ